MGVFDRNYVRDRGAREEVSRVSVGETALTNFVKTTYKFFAGSLLLATVGAFVGLFNIPVVSKFKFLIFIVEIALLIGLSFTKRMPGVNVGIFALFSFISGVAIAPLLGSVLAINPSIVPQALAMTTIIFGIMSIFGIKTSKDLSGMGTALFWSAIVIMVFGLLNVFFFHSPLIQFGIASVVVVIFSLFVAYDTQNIVRGNYDSPVEAAISLYLDFLNIFTALLQIMGLLSNKD